MCSSDLMMHALSDWTKRKPAAKGLGKKQVSALVFSVFGGWLYYLGMVRQGMPLEPLRDTLLENWAAHWAAALDTTD